jgi:hypothetical protein
MSSTLQSAQFAAAANITLNPTDAIRASVALEQAVDKLNFLSSLTPDVNALHDEVATMVGGELTRVIDHQRALETRYDNLVEQRAVLKSKGHAHKAKLKEVITEIETVSYELRESVKTIIRSLKDNPDVGDSFARIAEERQKLISMLEKAVIDLRETGSFRNLADFVHAELARREKLLAVTAREEEITKTVGELSATLTEEDEKHTKECDVRRAEVAVLKERTRKLKVDTSMTLRYARKEINAKIDSNSKEFIHEEEIISKEAEVLKRKIEVEAIAHTEAAAILKREQEEASKLAEEWKAKIAADLAARQLELKTLIEQRDAQRVELVKYQDRYEDDMQSMVETKAAADLETERILEAGAEAMRKKIAATQLQKILYEMFLSVQGFLAAQADGKKKK